MLSSEPKGHSKINGHIKRNLYAWITLHPQVVQSPISNYCLKVVFYDQTEPQLVPNSLPQVSVRELHNSLVSDPNDGGLKDARDEVLSMHTDYVLYAHLFLNALFFGSLDNTHFHGSEF